MILTENDVKFAFYDFAKNYISESFGAEMDIKPLIGAIDLCNILLNKIKAESTIKNAEQQDELTRRIYVSYDDTDCDEKGYSD